MFRLVMLFALAAVSAALPTLPSKDLRIDVNANWRIVGGSDAADGQFPYIVTLRGAGGAPFCGGSIINNQWVMSAAHCLQARSTDNTFVVAGTNTLNADGTRYNSARIIVHRYYDPLTVQNDIALINLTAEITFSDVVAAVGLNTATVGSEPAVLSGWGTTSYPGSMANQLQYLNTRTLTHAACEQIWGADVTENQICAFTVSGEGACHGDSGGPLTLAANGLQIGIVSWGVPCARGYPDVYARVSAYGDWINDQI